MAAGTSRKITAASARAHTRRPRPKATTSKFSGLLKKILLVGLVGLLAWAYQATKPPPPKICGSINGPSITASRVKLKDGRHLAYLEYGVKKDIAKHKIVFVHGFDCFRHDVSAITASLSQGIVESKGIYMVSFDRPGYGESDPHPNQTVDSLAFDIEELADLLGLGSKFYLVGFSMGGQIVWSGLKNIPNRLAGAALIAPAINYWWSGIPANISQQAYDQLLLQDRWALRVAHHAPWLTYWWNTQKWFPGFSIIAHNTNVFSALDHELFPRIDSIRKEYEALVRPQGEFESIHRDLMIGFGKWGFNPTDLKNPFPDGEGSVHLWQGDDDMLLSPVTLQRHIVRQLPWVQYHEVPGAGHLFLFADGMADSIIQSLVA